MFRAILGNSFFRGFIILLILIVGLFYWQGRPLGLPNPIQKVVHISVFSNEILTKQTKIVQRIAHQFWLNTVDKLPKEADFWTNLQALALQNGGRYALQSYFKTIRQTQDTSLRYLSLANQNLYYLPRNIGDYKNLRYLSVKNNRLQAINPKLANCSKLRKLDLSSNQMYDLPFNIIYLSQIEELILSDNRLSTLPSYFFNMSGLKVLDISNFHPRLSKGYNKFEKLPEVLLKMNHIEKLFLDKLPLQKLPSDIYRMQNLQVLSLNGARALDLNQAFEALSKIPNLIALDLSFIGRRTLPSSIAKLKNLKVLIWHEENKVNMSFIQNQLVSLLPNTKVFHAGRAGATPFLRGNSIQTIENSSH